MARILVTGATGNVGAELIRQLAAAGLPTVAAMRAPGREDLPVPAVRFDFTNPDTFADALDDVSQVFLLRPPALVNVERDMQPFIDAMVGQGVRQVVFVSVQGAEHNEKIPHRRIERMLERSGLATTVLRPSFFMQNFSTTHREEIRDRDELYVPAGQAQTNFIDVRDIAAAALVLFQQEGHRGHAYTLTGPENLSYAEVARIFSEALGREIVYPAPSTARFLWGAWRRGRPWKMVLVLAMVYNFAKRGAPEKTDDLTRLLGREPRSLRTFVRDYRDCWLR